MCWRSKAYNLFTFTAEALGAIGDPADLSLLEEYSTDDAIEVSIPDYHCSFRSNSVAITCTACTLPGFGGLVHCWQCNIQLIPKFDLRVKSILIMCKKIINNDNHNEKFLFLICCA